MSRLGNGARLMSAIQAIVARHIYRSQQFVIFGDRLSGPPADDRVDDIVLRLATPSDLEHLDELEPYGRGASQCAYVKRENDWLFVACRGDRIVATARYSRVVRDQVISRVVHLEPKQVWGADQFCLPEYRNRGISRLLALFANRFLAPLGYTEVASSVAATNTASIRMTLHKGCKPLYYVSYSRFLLWERLRVSKNIPKHV